MACDSVTMWHCDLKVSNKIAVSRFLVAYTRLAVIPSHRWTLYIKNFNLHHPCPVYTALLNKFTFCISHCLSVSLSVFLNRLSVSLGPSLSIPFPLSLSLSSYPSRSLPRALSLPLSLPPTLFFVVQCCYPEKNKAVYSTIREIQ